MPLPLDHDRETCSNAVRLGIVHDDAFRLYSGFIIIASGTATHDNFSLQTDWPLPITTAVNNDFILSSCVHGSNASPAPVAQSPFTSNLSGDEGGIYLGLGSYLQNPYGAITPTFSVATGGTNAYNCGTIAMEL
jgi:hypothetical protein